MEQEFKYGDEVEVRDGEDCVWMSATYFCNDIDEDVEHRYIARILGGHMAMGYRYCRHRRPDFKLNDPVIVGGGRGRRHFAGWDEDGRRLLAYKNGATSFTGSRTTTWSTYRKPTEEELNGWQCDNE